MKRLTEPFNPNRRRQRSTPEWRRERSWYKRIGVDEKVVFGLLEGAETRRFYYEESLKLRPWAQSEAEKEKATVLPILKSAEPFIAFLKDNPTAFGRLGMTLEARVNTFRTRFLARLAFAERHRPGERWLPPTVREFATLFRQHGQSWNRTLLAIHTALCLDGHDDRVTLNMIRHILRAQRGHGRRATRRKHSTE